MNYHNITKEDMLNGEGIRSVLWVSGCMHHCPGCQNPQTWSEHSGILFDEEAKRELMESLKPDYISGLTLSGGDPLFPNNREEILQLVKLVKELYPNKTIWLYTGFLYEDVKDLEIMKYVDVVVDGKFEQNLLDNSLMWRGSSNQRIIRLEHNEDN